MADISNQLTNLSDKLSSSENENILFFIKETIKLFSNNPNFFKDRKLCNIFTKIIQLIENEISTEEKQIFSLMKENNDDVTLYTFFGRNDPDAYFFYCAQQASMWVVSEIPFQKDINDYNNKLIDRQRLLIDEISGFFVLGDGLINASVLRQMQEAQSSMEVGFLFFQGAIEVVHQQTYGMFIKQFAGSIDKEKKIFNMVKNIACVKRKADFIQKYIDSDIAPCLRALAQACAEGIFFVTLFGVIFYFKRLNLLEAFIFANEQISKDETMHRDFYCNKSEKRGIEMYSKEALEIIEEAVQIETEYITYLLRDIRQSELNKINNVENNKVVDELIVISDVTTGLTVDNFIEYIKLLADQILVFCGLEIHYNSKPNLSWMDDIGLDIKTNFYEKKVGNYKKASLKTLLNWEKMIGEDANDQIYNGVENFHAIKF